MDALASFRYVAGGLNTLPFATKTDAAYAMIRARILTGSLEAGAVVEQEALALELSLSTTPVREALRRLEAEGLLTQVAHREMRVPELSEKELVELYDVRLKLDPYAVLLGARLATDEQRARIRELLAASAESSDMVRLEQNYQLHRAMYLTSDNQVLIEMLDRLWDRSDRYRMILIRSDDMSDTAHAEHEEIVEAFCRGDGKTAGKLLREHLTASRATLVREVRQRALTL